MQGSYGGLFDAMDDGNYYTNQSVDVTAGKAYRFLGYVAIPPQPDTTFTFRLLARWRNASNAVIGTDTIYTTSTSPDPMWYAMNKNLVAPPGATSVLIVPSVLSLNGYIYIDKFFFVEW